MVTRGKKSGLGGDAALGTFGLCILAFDPGDHQGVAGGGPGFFEFVADDGAPLVCGFVVGAEDGGGAACVDPHFGGGALDAGVGEDAFDGAGDGGVDFAWGQGGGGAVFDAFDFDGDAVAEAVDLVEAVGGDDVFVDDAGDGELSAGLGDDVFEGAAAGVGVVGAGDFDNGLDDPAGDLVGGGVEEDDVGGLGGAVLVFDGVGVAFGGEAFPAGDGDVAGGAGLHVANLVEPGCELGGELIGGLVLVDVRGGDDPGREE